MTLEKFVILFFAIGIIGCQQDVDTFIPDPIDPIILPAGDIDRFFDAITQAIDPMTTHTIQADPGGIVVTNRGTIFAFGPQSFRFSNGDTVKGPVEIQIIELHTPGEILAFGKPTRSNGHMLTTAGEFHLTALKDGEKVNLAPGKQVRILVEDPNPKERMELFYLDEQENPADGRTESNWVEADGDPNSWSNVMRSEWQIQGDSGQILSGFGYECWSDSLKWINIDLFNDIPEDELTDVCVDLPEIYTNTNTAVFLIFDDFNGIIMLPGNADEMLFCNYYTQFIKVGVPLGNSVRFVVISEQGEDCYHFALVEATIVENHMEEISPEKMSFESIKEIIMSL